jgi:hypothetical protein
MRHITLRITLAILPYLFTLPGVVLVILILLYCTGVING